MRERKWHKNAIELKKQRLSNYEIARRLWGVGSKESTLRYFFKQANIASLIPAINQAKVLFWDIENAPFLSFHYDKYGINVGNDAHVTEKFMLSHSWAWGDGEIFGDVLTPEQARSQNDESLVIQAWHLLDEADIVVAHNGRKFDVPMINGFFLRHGLPAPSPYKIVDTYRVAKKNFKLTSNSLAYLAKFLGVEQKLDSGGWDAWKKSYFGDQEALTNMLVYNKGDIVTLRGVYYKLQGWSNDSVNMGMFSDHTAVCSRCGSDDLSIMDGKFHVTGVSKFQLFRCGKCNGFSRLRKSTGKVVSLTSV